MSEKCNTAAAEHKHKAEHKAENKAEHKAENKAQHRTEYKAQHKAERHSAASGNIWDVGAEHRGEARYQSVRQNGRIGAMKRKEITEAQSI